MGHEERTLDQRKREPGRIFNCFTLWSAFQDELPDNNSNKIPTALRGIMLFSQLYGCARDICKTISMDVIKSEDGVSETIKAIHKRDALSTVSDLFMIFYLHFQLNVDTLNL